MSHCCFLRACQQKQPFFPGWFPLHNPQESHSYENLESLSCWTSSPDQQLSFPGKIRRVAEAAAPSLFVYSLKPREAGLLSHSLTRCVALNKPLNHSVLLFSPAGNLRMDDAILCNIYPQTEVCLWVRWRSKRPGWGRPPPWKCSPLTIGQIPIWPSCG